MSLSPILLISPNQSMQFLVNENFSKLGFGIHHIQGLNELLTLDKSLQFSVCMIEDVEDKSEEYLKDILVLLKKEMPALKVFILHRNGLSQNAVDLFKMDVEGIYCYPYEQELLLNSLFEFVNIDLTSSNLCMDMMTKVSILEINSRENLPFDVYLYFPMNDRFLLYRKEKSKLGEDSKVKFIGKNKDILYIRKDSLKAYREYTAKILSEHKHDNNLSQIEKAKKIKEDVKTLMSGFFTKGTYNEMESRAFLETTSKIISSFVGDETDNSLYDRILKLTSQSHTNYAHCANVATFCAIFGIMAELDDLENLSIGGLLHDIGLSNLPIEIVDQDPLEMSFHEYQQYKMHPFLSVELIKKKQIPVNDIVLRMIQEHHECFNGTGFPKGLQGNEISRHAKILAMADALDYYTSFQAGKEQMSPDEAILKFAGLKDGIAAPFFDPSFHGPIVSTLIEQMDPKLQNIADKMQLENKSKIDEMAKAVGSTNVIEEELSENSMGEIGFNKNAQNKVYTVDTEEKAGSVIVSDYGDDYGKISVGSGKKGA